MHLTHGDIIEIVSESTKTNEREKDTNLMSCGHFCMSCHYRDICI